MNANEERNKDLVRKRLSDPKTWGYGKLGRFFNIHRSTVKEIFIRDMDKYGTKKQITNFLKGIKKV